MGDLKPRGTFRARIGAILVAAGGSVGLGNIWRFPYILGEGGGGAFLLIYLLCIFVLGMPIMLAEMSLGRATKCNASLAYSKFKPNFGFLGKFTVLISYLIIGFYLVVSGWTVEYFTASIAGGLSVAENMSEYSEMFQNMVGGGFSSLIYAYICLLVTHVIVAQGVEKGIEKFSRVLMPIFFIAIIVLCINSLMMPGRDEALSFLFKPDFSKINGRIVLQALGQAFFSLSIAFGAHIIYGSYFSDKANIGGITSRVVIIDTLVALLAGVMIFPAVFSFEGISHEAGASLVFITLPAIFNSIMFGGVWSTIFFGLLIVAAITSTISLHEVVTAYFIEERKISRIKAARITTLLVGLLTTVAGLSLTGASWGTFWGVTIFDGIDYFTANIMLPVAAVGTSIYIGWLVKKPILEEQLTNHGELKNGYVKVVKFLLKWVCPITLLVLLLDNIGVFNF